MHGNTSVGSVLDRASRIDWDAVEQIAEQLGPRTRGLVAARNVIGLRIWVREAAATTAAWSIETAQLYERIAELVSTKGRRP
jgi:hypothetical protein